MIKKLPPTKPKIHMGQSGNLKVQSFDKDR